MNVNHTQLKKFAVRSRERLLSVTDENTAYTSFMRLCAVDFVCPQFISKLADMNLNERHSAFAEKCHEYSKTYGGVFNNSGSDVEYPDILLNEILADISKIPLYGDDILGWMHQYYNEPYRESLNFGLKKSKKLDADDIAPTTQVFTPDWIVKYLVENTLVKRWYEGGGCSLKGFDSCIFGEIKPSSPVEPERLTFLDPCMGSGNILLYAFDVYMEMYRSQGISDNIAANLILQNNLFGFEIDERVCAAAETALRIKAARFGADTKPRIFLLSGNGMLEADAENPDRRFDMIVTNPPYLGRSAMSDELSELVQREYGSYSSDLFLAVAARSCALAAENGRLGFLTPYTWLFIKTCEPFRRMLLSEKSLETLVQLEYSSFDNAVVPLCMFTFSNRPEQKKCSFLRLSSFKGDLESQRKLVLSGISQPECRYRFEADTADFLRLPSAPLVYWLSDSVRKTFFLAPLGETADVREGLITGDNERFLRRWYEVADCKTAFRRIIGKKWYPLNKGGDQRRWYGNREFVINWENDGEEIRNFRDEKGRLRSRPQNTEYCFRKAASWSALTSGELSVRYYDESFMFNVAGGCAFTNDSRRLLWLIGLMNSKVTAVLSQALNPTMNMNPGDMARLPVPEYTENKQVCGLIRDCIGICREDWDSFETSYDFQRHPLLP